MSETDTPLCEQVQTILADSLFTDAELGGAEGPPSDVVLVEGIVRKWGFHPDRLEAHKEEVRNILALFPDEFMQGKGGGWSFLNLCNTKDGVQWGEHPDMEALCCLAIGLGLGKWQMPKEMWSIFPGGMPYVAFTI